jgi:hypothetical protein
MGNESSNLILPANNEEYELVATYIDKKYFSTELSTKIQNYLLDYFNSSKYASSQHFFSSPLCDNQHITKFIIIRFSGRNDIIFIFTSDENIFDKEYTKLTSVTIKSKKCSEKDIYDDFIASILKLKSKLIRYTGACKKNFILTMLLSSFIFSQDFQTLTNKLKIDSHDKFNIMEECDIREFYKRYVPVLRQMIYDLCDKITIHNFYKFKKWWDSITQNFKNISQHLSYIGISSVLTDSLVMTITLFNSKMKEIDTLLHIHKYAKELTLIFLDKFHSTIYDYDNKMFMYVHFPNAILNMELLTKTIDEKLSDEEMNELAYILIQFICDSQSVYGSCVYTNDDCSFMTQILELIKQTFCDSFSLQKIHEQIKKENELQHYFNEIYNSKNTTEQNTSSILHKIITMNNDTQLAYKLSLDEGELLIIHTNVCFVDRKTFEHDMIHNFSVYNSSLSSSEFLSGLCDEYTSYIETNGINQLIYTKIMTKWDMHTLSSSELKIMEENDKIVTTKFMILNDSIKHEFMSEVNMFLMHINARIRMTLHKGNNTVIKFEHEETIFQEDIRKILETLNIPLEFEDSVIRTSHTITLAEKSTHRQMWLLNEILSYNIKHSI